MSWHKKVDGNQSAIVEELRGLGCSVLSLASIGKGCPDLLIGVAKINFLVEIKADERKSLTPDQIEFVGCWQGFYVIGWATEQIIRHIVNYLDLMGQSEHPDCKHLKNWLKEKKESNNETIRQRRKHYF